MRKPLDACSPPRLQISPKLTPRWTILSATIHAPSTSSIMFATGLSAAKAKMSRVDVKQLLAEVARIVSADAEVKRFSLFTELPEFLPPVRADKTHLTQAILNLVLNAFDSVTESAGPGAIALRACQRAPNEIPDSVRDSGKGINSNVNAKTGRALLHDQAHRNELGARSRSFNHRESWRAYLGDPEL
jgi:light-regulated signal transduction histidine kinase (bacteriophytochrome)